MAITISLTGRLADITSRPVGQITSAYIKTPVATVGQGLDITLSQPVPVVFDSDGVFTVDVVDGLGWLFVQGVGWTESVRFVAAAGMSQMWEAIVNAMPESTGFSRYIQNMQASDASVAEAEAAASAAAQSASDAAQSASESSGSASDARGWAEAAATSASNAASSESNAATSETNAKASETNAKTSETNAASSESNAASSETNASRSAEAAATSASNAASSESNAATSETNAASSASSASGSAAAAAQSASAAQAAATQAAAGVPDATSTVKGKIKLTNDLGGTADAPTVPGLAGKADVGHTHAIGDVPNTQEMGGWAGFGGKAIVTWPDGWFSIVSDPTDPGHPARKNYVDASIIAAPKMHVWNGSGTWVAPSTAGPNDTVLNTATGEIYSVKVV